MSATWSRKARCWRTFAPETMQAELAADRAPRWPKPRRRSPKRPPTPSAAAQLRADRRAERSADQPVHHRRAHRAGALDSQRAGRVQARKCGSARPPSLAPDDGVISARSATVGARAAGRPGAVPPDPRQGRLEWRAEVTVGRARARQARHARYASRPRAARRSPGTVRMVAPTVDPQTRNGIVYVDLPAPGERARRHVRARRVRHRAARRALTLPQSAVLLREGFSLRLQGRRRTARSAQVKVDSRPARRRPHRDHRRARTPDARVVAIGGGFLADGDTVRVRRRRRAGGAGERRRPRRVTRTPRHDQRLVLVDPQPDPRRCCCSSCSPLVGLMSFQGDEDPELPGHRPADGHRHRVAAGRVAVAARDRRRAQDREPIATLQGVKHIYTTVQDGIVDDDGRVPPREAELQEAVDDVRDAVSRMRSDLPADLRDPIITKVDLAGSPILTYTVASSRMDDEALSWFVDDTVAQGLLAVRGVGAVTRVGGVDARGARRARPGAPAGAQRDRRRHLAPAAPDPAAKPRAAAPTSAAPSSRCARSPPCSRRPSSAQLEIALGDGRRIRLDQVATVSDTVAEQRSAALLDGKPVVGFEIVRSRGAGEVEVDARRAQALDDAGRSAPGHQRHRGVQLRRSGRRRTTRARWSCCSRAPSLAVLVVWLFLRDWRATLRRGHRAAAVDHPGVRRRCRCSASRINVVTLLALSLVVGILVDDAIVEVENIMRHLRMGKTPLQAAMEAADEIGLAVIATTFTLIAVFLPTAFMSGMPGKFFVQFGWTAAIAVFFSLVVARMLTPMMAAYILKRADEGAPAKAALDRRRTCAGCAGACSHRVADDARRDCCSSSARSRWCRCCRPASSRPTTCRRRRCTIELPPGATLRRRPARRRSRRARSCSKNPHVKLRLHRGRRRRDRRRPVRGAAAPPRCARRR